MPWLSFRTLLRLLPVAASFVNPLLKAPVQTKADLSSLLQVRVKRLTRRKSATVFRVDGSVGDLAVKVINRRKGRDYLRFFTSLKSYKASMEFHSAEMLEGIGLQVPQPVASFRNWNPFSTVDSIFVAEYVPDLKTGDEYILTKGETSESKSLFLTKYAQDMKRMLDAGLLNVDAHPGNVLWSGRDLDPLVWIDNEVEAFDASQRAEMKERIIVLLRRKAAKNETRLTDEELSIIEDLI
jgi:hypothetical protein